MSRTIKDIRQEYANAATALGQITFQLRESEQALSNLEMEAKKQSDKMRHLNKEALKLQKESELAKLDAVAEEVPSGEQA